VWIRETYGVFAAENQVRFGSGNHTVSDITANTLLRKAGVSHTSIETAFLRRLEKRSQACLLQTYELEGYG